MAGYTLAVRTPAAAANAPFCDLRTGAGERGRLLELGVFLAAATATNFGLVRPATVGAASVSAAGQAEDPADTASTLSVGTGWTTAPTIPAAPLYLRRYPAGGTVGAGVVWTWYAQNGLVVPLNSSLLLWNLGAAAGAALDVYMVWDE